jgi:hypothetical protein
MSQFHTGIRLVKTRDTGGFGHLIVVNSLYPELVNGSLKI